MGFAPVRTFRSASSCRKATPSPDSEARMIDSENWACRPDHAFSTDWQFQPDLHENPNRSAAGGRDLPTGRRTRPSRRPCSVLASLLRSVKENGRRTDLRTRHARLGPDLQGTSSGDIRICVRPPLGRRNSMGSQAIHHASRRWTSATSPVRPRTRRNRTHTQPDGVDGERWIHSRFQ